MNRQWRLVSSDPAMRAFLNDRPGHVARQAVGAFMRPSNRFEPITRRVRMVFERQPGSR
jgi:hypothetical protein